MAIPKYRGLLEWAPVTHTVTPSVITDPDALMAVRRASYDSDQPRVLLDQSGGGGHLYFGGTDVQDQLLGYGPGQVGKVGLVSADSANRGLGLLNTGQQYNLGAGVNQVRLTVNFNAVLDNGTQTLVALVNTAARRSYYVQLLATGLVTTGFSPTGDGTTLRTITAATTLATAGYSNFEDIWVRVTWDFSGNPDTVTIEHSDDGQNWSTLLAATSTGNNDSGMYQAPATDYLEFGTTTLGTADHLRGGCVFSVLAEENSGSGYTTSWSWDGATASYNDFTALGSQESANAADPSVETDHLRIVRNVDEMRTFECRVTADVTVENLYSVDPGEVLTIVFAAAMDSVEAGAGSFHIPFSTKGTGQSSQPGYSPENDGNQNGFDYRVSNGSTQSATAVSQIADDDELAATVYEIDGPDGEIRMRAVGEASVDAAYADQGSGTHAFPFMVGRTGTSGFGMSQDFWGCFIIKRELTTVEMQEIADWLLEAAA